MYFVQFPALIVFQEILRAEIETMRTGTESSER